MAANESGGAGIQAMILDTLDREGSIQDSRKLSLNRIAVQGALDSLLSKDMVLYEQLSEQGYKLTAEGQDVIQNGSYEWRFFSAIEDGMSIDELKDRIPPAIYKMGQGPVFKHKWVEKRAENKLYRVVNSFTDSTKDECIKLNQGDLSAAEDLRKRKLAEKTKDIYYKIQKGPKFTNQVQKLETDLTVEQLTQILKEIKAHDLAHGGRAATTETTESSTLSSFKFKDFNFDSKGIDPQAGSFHPLLKVREEFRSIFFEMGFKEMPTNRFVESSFWNFDALFVPQQHAARDQQDTFFLKEPSHAGPPPAEYQERVHQVHENGGYASIGYRYPWSAEEASKLVLRTHTTAISSAMLYEIANSKDGFKPTKMFSIDRVFRNESVDATHLAEFHQVEGVIADYDLTLGDLIGFMQTFFAKMGFHQLKFKPAYNPYTEPSMEIFAYHEGLRRWIEIGNSGMFRPEMLEPMGLPPNVRVHGWGLSLERPTMIRYGRNNIRDLVGHKSSIEFIKSTPAVRFD